MGYIKPRIRQYCEMTDCIIFPNKWVCRAAAIAWAQLFDDVKSSVIAVWAHTFYKGFAFVYDLIVLNFAGLTKFVSGGSGGKHNIIRKISS